jgi:hypothetical protein
LLKNGKILVCSELYLEPLQMPLGVKNKPCHIPLNHRRV